ncbi:sigma-70 family RNA polymerase sigma factor [Streptomyces sp. NBC_00083]|uniref:sigma-70 family RNA polymerase sigma factor n=1 Tax=Streptomyces sp. NBC_00083 TaxID=2975647 RepID=UPI00224CBA1E|nr:sigma-70 family RNA polymerase sigma factor [Streptomyces sp. NBC_00083]MCX5388194.1 sigma-70 family RNA polymerase sigma factor [Streptomyces sp. NBC_00083]
MISEQEAAVVVAARSGDQRARDELVAGYLPLVYNIVGRALNGHADVDDVVQESLLRMLDGLGSLRDPAAFRSWLVAVTMNEVRRYWQGHRRAPVDGGLQDAYDIADPGADFVDLTIVRLGLSGQRKEVTEATRWLETDDRALLSLWWLEAAGVLTRGEVASALDLSAEHAAVRVQRMKGQLETARVVVRALATSQHCGELSGLTFAWDGVPSALWRKRIARHARTCAVCSGHWSGLIPAEGLLVGLALVPVAATTAGLLAALHGHLPGLRTPDLQTAAHATTQPLAQAGTQPAPEASRASHGAHAAGRRRAPASRRDLRDRRARRRRRAGAVIAALAVVTALGGAYHFLTDSGDDASRSVADAPATTTDAAADGISTKPLPPSPSAAKSPAQHSSSPTPSPSKHSAPPAKPSPRPAPPKPAPSTRRAAPSSTDTSMPAAVQQVLDLVNSERSKAGCSALTSNSKLYDAALKHSENMAAQNFFDHTDPSGAGPGERITAAGYQWSAYGENIARGQADAASVMDSWMNSPGHRANILNCGFKEIGIGVHYGSGGPWWTQDFGTRS